MGLKYEIDETEHGGLEEGQRGLYVASDKPGKFRLDVEGATSLGALINERNDHKATKAKLSRYQVDGKELDVEAYQRDREELERLRAERATAADRAKESKKPEDDGKVRELSTKLERLEKQLESEQQERQRTAQRLRTKVIEGAIDKTCEELRVQQQFYGDARLRASQFTVLDDETTVVLANPDGTPYEDDSGRHVPVGKWFETFVKDERPGWLAPSGGGGARGASGPTAARGVIDRNDGASVLANLPDIAKGLRAVQ